MRLLVADPDREAVAWIRHIVQFENWSVSGAETGADALGKARDEGPDAILTELNLPDMTGPDLCRALRQQSETAATPIIVVSANPGVAGRVSSLRAGATDYLVKPPDAQELLARLKAALDLRVERTGFVVAVVGAKGGVGASVVAVNVAVALRRETRADVLLLDAATHSAAAGVMLNLQAAHKAGRLLPNLADLEPSEFAAVLTRHASGLQALLLEEQGTEAIRPEELHRILVVLRRMHRFVVVDTPPLRDGNAGPILELADRVLLVLTPEITALRGARMVLEQAAKMGLAPERVVAVLNRSPLRGGLQRGVIESALGTRMQITIPDDVRLVAYGVNRGVPLVESHRRSGVSRQLDVLAKSLLKAAQAPWAGETANTRQAEGVKWAVQ